jgi:hypothetical protein
MYAEGDPKRIATKRGASQGKGPLLESSLKPSSII